VLDYAIVTPARDEETLLPELATSVLAQTVIPKAWIIVDNGSTDTTLAIGRRLAVENEWISCIFTGGPERPTRGGPVVEAFEAGLNQLDDPAGVIVKLDADVRIPPDYFERLLRAFEQEPSLGIASGTRLEPDGEGWRVRRVTGTMVRAQARAYRSECLSGVLPLERCVGWDHVDQMKAAARGWQSLEVGDLFFRHVRPDGARDGNDYWSLQGAAAHYLGYRPTYVLLRTLHRFPRDPKAARMIAGYLGALISGAPRCGDRWVVAKTREQQRLSQLPDRVRELRSGRVSSRP
jgi:biofilm PGA synthesis N-glycosyltransferase PgaC